MNKSYEFFESFIADDDYEEVQMWHSDKFGTIKFNDANINFVTSEEKDDIEIVVCGNSGESIGYFHVYPENNVEIIKLESDLVAFKFTSEKEILEFIFSI